MPNVDFDKLPPAQLRLILLQGQREGEEWLGKARPFDMATAYNLSLVARKLAEVEAQLEAAQQEQEVA